MVDCCQIRCDPMWNDLILKGGQRPCIQYQIQHSRTKHDYNKLQQLLQQVRDVIKYTTTTCIITQTLPNFGPKLSIKSSCFECTIKFIKQIEMARRLVLLIKKCVAAGCRSIRATTVSLCYTTDESYLVKTFQLNITATIRWHFVFWLKTLCDEWINVRWRNWQGNTPSMNSKRVALIYFHLNALVCTFQIVLQYFYFAIC